MLNGGTKQLFFRLTKRTIVSESQEILNALSKYIESGREVSLNFMYMIHLCINVQKVSLTLHMYLHTLYKCTVIRIPTSLFLQNKLNTSV